MPQIILGPQRKSQLDGSVKRAAFSFLEKLAEDDTTPGLHVEPIESSVDPRVRTARVNDFWRAVLIKVGDPGNSYIYLGIHPHDDAIAYARTVQIRINPLNGIAELTSTPPEEAAVGAAPSYKAAPERAKPTPDDVDSTAYPLLETQGISADDLTGLGMSPETAAAAVTYTDEDSLADFAATIPTWQGLALLDLAVGKGLEGVRESLSLEIHERDTAVVETAEDLIRALKHPAARTEFAFIEGQDELREVIESDDFGAWRVFLHPEQRQYAERHRNGAFRLSGGAGTGKTVVLLHRARHLAQADPEARIVLTTFTRTLADSLRVQLRVLDPTLRIANELGGAGVYVGGVDQVARQVLRDAGTALGAREDAAGSVASVLGARTPQVLDMTANNGWRDAIARAGVDLPADLRSESFIQAEYATVVLPNRIVERADYLRARRPGRRVPLDRARRNAVWDVVEAYRASSAAAGSTDFEEKAMTAAAHLGGPGVAPPADHVLVDEAQDLTPARLLLMRALVAEGPNDLFLAEDSHQRIYGQRIVLSKYGINIRGRSRRLTLNYRTTHENLKYAVGVLGDDSAFADMEAGGAAVTGYRAARRGPEPTVVACETLTQEYDRATELIRGWTHEVASAETIGVLVHAKGTAESLLRALAERGIDAKFVGTDTEVSRGKVVIMTMHRSKGMEFTHVLLFGIDAGFGDDAFYVQGMPEQDRADAALRDRSLLYVAATRARDKLVVMWKGAPSGLLPDGTVAGRQP